MRWSFLLLFITLFSAKSHAGDPCGGFIPFYDVGVPSYADRAAALTAQDESQILPLAELEPDVDRVAYFFAYILGQQGEACHTFPYAYDPERYADVSGALLDGLNRFRCHDAHIVLGHRRSLEWAANHPEDTAYVPHALSPELYYMRGSRRVIIAMPYWGSACFDLDDLRTEQGIVTAANEFRTRAVNAYEEERWRNP